MQWKLEGLRKEKGLSQVELAELLGINTTTYRNKVYGRSQFTLAEMFKLSNIFDKCVEDIFLDSNSTKR